MPRMTEGLLASLEAERQIRRLIARYGEAAALKDAELARELFAEDAEVRIADLPVRVGRDEIVAGFARTLSAFRWLDQKSDSGLIDVDGDRARAIYQVAEFNERLDDGEIAMITGTYEDDYVRRGGRWYFHRRRFTLRSRAVLAHSQGK
jgi:uncharacterized protein (TIGR02246 family)